MQAEIPSSISAGQVVPMFDKVLILRDRPTKTKGGIILTDAAQQYMSMNIGRVAAIGPSADDSLKIGQCVIFGKHAGDSQKLPGTEDEIYVVLDTDIWAVIEE